MLPHIIPAVSRQTREQIRSPNHEYFFDWSLLWQKKTIWEGATHTKSAKCCFQEKHMENFETVYCTINRLCHFWEI